MTLPSACADDTLEFTTAALINSLEANQVQQYGASLTIPALAEEAATGKYHVMLHNGDISYARCASCMVVPLCCTAPWQAATGNSHWMGQWRHFLHTIREKSNVMGRQRHLPALYAGCTALLHCLSIPSIQHHAVWKCCGILHTTDLVLHRAHAKQAWGT